MNNESISFLKFSLPVNVRTLYISTDTPLRDIHFHKAIELVRADEGVVVCEFGDERVTLSKGDIILINRHIIHKLRCERGSAHITYIQTEVDSFFPAVSDTYSLSVYNFIHSNNLTPYRVFTNDEDLQNTFSDIVREFNQRGAFFESYIVADIYRIGAIMQRYGLFPDEASLNKNYITKLMPAIEYAQQNYNSKIYLDDVSRIMNMDKFYFCKLFKKTVGSPFIDYVNFLRLEKAAKMLSTTDKNISEIAYDCGFASLQYFNKLFKRKNSCLPSVYRKLNTK